MCKAVAYKGLKTMENYQTVTPKNGRGRVQGLQEVVFRSPSIWWAPGGRLWEVPTTGLWPGKFWCFGSVDAYGRWPLTRGDRRWSFDCIPNLCKRFLNLSLWAPLKFVLRFKRYEKISWLANGSHYFFLLLFMIYYYFFLLRPRKYTATDLMAVIRRFRTENETSLS